MLTVATTVPLIPMGLLAEAENIATAIEMERWIAREFSRTLGLDGDEMDLKISVGSRFRSYANRFETPLIRGTLT